MAIKYEYALEDISQKPLPRLNQLGSEGWYMITVDGGYAWLVRAVDTDTGTPVFPGTTVTKVGVT